MVMWWPSLLHMTIEIPDDEVPRDLAFAVIRALVRYADLDDPGAELEVKRSGGEDHVRVYEGTEHFEAAPRPET